MSCAAILLSILLTLASALFQRALSSPATNRLSGAAHRIAGKHAGQHSAPLPGHGHGPHEPDPAAQPPVTRLSARAFDALASHRFQLSIRSLVQLLLLATAKMNQVDPHAWLAQTLERMGIPQPKVSGMMRGDFTNLSERKLMDCLNRLGYDIEIKVRPASEPVGHLTLATV